METISYTENTDGNVYYKVKIYKLKIFYNYNCYNIKRYENCILIDFTVISRIHHRLWPYQK